MNFTSGTSLYMWPRGMLGERRGKAEGDYEGLYNDAWL